MFYEMLGGIRVRLWYWCCYVHSAQ